MMNVLSLSLLIASMTAASVWSPPPPPPPPPPDHHANVVKEGRRVIVVEYEREDLQEPSWEKSFKLGESERSVPPGLSEKMKERFDEVVSVLPNVGQGISFSPPPPPPPPPAGHTGKELICDAFGKCKEKISSLLGAFKDEATETASNAVEELSKGVNGAREAVKETVQTAKDTVDGRANEVVEEAKKAGRELVKKGKHVEEGAKNVLQTAKDAVENTKLKGGKIAAVLQEGGKAAMEMGRNAVEDVAKKACDKVEEVREGFGEMSMVAEETGARAVDNVKKNLTEIASEAKEVAYDVYLYFLSADSVTSLMSLVHLWAFAATYGICFWVTFISSHVLSNSLPRQQFGIAQSRIYPVYFRSLAYGIAMSWMAHLVSDQGVADGLQLYNLPWTLLLVLINLFYLEPRASKVMFERLKLEKEEGRGRDVADMLIDPVTPTTNAAATSANIGIEGVSTPLSAALPVREGRESAKNQAVKLNLCLKRLNTSSSFLNVLTLMGLTWHLVYLAKRLQTTC